MLFHLPIVVLTTLSPVPVSDTVPKFDIVKECRFEGGTSEIFDRCSRDEAEALRQLQAEWPQFSGINKNACLTEATAAGFASYVELVICLEMERDLKESRNGRANPPGTPTGQSQLPVQPEMSVVDGHE